MEVAAGRDVGRLVGVGPERLGDIDHLVGARSAWPDHLVERERPTAGCAAGRERLADGDLETGLAARRRTHRLERGVEMAKVRRAQDELGEEPGQRRGFEADRPTLPIDRGPADPAATTGEVKDDVAGLRMGLDPSSHEAGRWRRREPIEERQREAGLRANERRATDHGRQPTRAPAVSPPCRAGTRMFRPSRRESSATRVVGRESVAGGRVARLSRACALAKPRR